MFLPLEVMCSLYKVRMNKQIKSQNNNIVAIGKPMLTDFYAEFIGEYIERCAIFFSVNVEILAEKCALLRTKVKVEVDGSHTQV